MTEFAVAGDDLKKLMKIAKKRPLTFAYCPGQSAETDLFALHRKKPAPMMAKALRAEGEGNKVAFGTLTVEGKLVTLQCDRVLPALAKKAKKFLKFNKLLRNVRILDEDGNVIEEDIEELPDTAEDDTPEIAADEEEDAGTEETFDPAELIARIKALEPRIAAVDDDAAKPLKKAIVEAIGLLKAGDAERVAAILDRVEALLAKLAAPEAPKEAPPQAGTASQQKLQQAAAQLAQRIKALPEGDVRAMLADQLRDVVGAIQDGAIERTITRLKALQKDLEQAERNLAGDGADQAQPPAAAAPAPAGDPLEIWNDAKEQTDSEIGRLQARLRQEGHPDLDRIAEYGLNGITEGNQAGLMKRLFEYRAAGSDGKAAAAEKLVQQTSEYRKFLAGSELIALCEQNPLVSVDIRGPLDAALTRIETSVKRQSA